MFYSLIHLPTAQEVYSGWYIEEVENFLAQNFFYKDPTDDSISFDLYEKGDVEMCMYDTESKRIIRGYFLIPLNKCEFEVVECGS